MKKILFMLLVVGLLLAMTGATYTSHPAPKNFVALLAGKGEVPPRDTRARGLAVIHVNKAGNELGFVLAVANIKNVVFAHIHCGAPGVNAPVGVTLYMADAPGGGRFSGVLARGVRTAPDAGNACGWTTIGDVVTAMRSGNTYVNVHTNDGVAPTNTGPGDFPGGEIRGQVRANGPHK